jgi:GT2 family glycosyltransferase
MRETPFCSVLIVNFNGLEHMTDCFSSLAELDYPKDRYEVVMVDDDSIDGSVDYSIFEDSIPPALKRRIIDGTLTEKDVEFLNSKKRC